MQSQLLTIIFLQFIYTKLPHDKLVDNFHQLLVLHLEEVINLTSEYQEMGKHFEERKLRLE